LAIYASELIPYSIMTTPMIKVKVSDFLKKLEHPLKAEIEKLREIILNSNSELTEQIKWNAPSFCFNGDDRITFKIHPPKNVQLIFHRGAKVRSDVESFSFEDLTGMIKWATKDRGVITFQNIQEIEERKHDLKVIVNKWIRAAAE
jgi:uncharacterized protein YdeI (YjbR/CyaY-like superfamily)